jgi:hypothetical protein
MSDLHNDEPTLSCLVGRTQLVKKIGNVVAKCKPPHVFGVHGDWGSGKTSFLHQLQGYLSGECPQKSSGTEFLKDPAWGDGWQPYDHVVVIWFEAWRYQNETAPVVALLHEMRSQLSFWSKLWQRTKKATSISIQSALIAFEDITQKIGIQASKVREVGEKWEKHNLAERLPSHTIRQFLEETLKKLLPRQKDNKPSPRLVVLIDDLDRCESEAAYKLLEGIKIYLNLPNCVFVLGMNQAIMESSIAKQLEKESKEPAEIRARDYLEKLCKDIWHLPFDRLKLFGALKEWLKQHQYRDEICKILVEEACIPANPRKLKAFCNYLYRLPLEPSVTIQNGDDKQRHVKILIIMAYLYQFHQDLYRILEWNPKFYQVIYRWCKGEESNHPTLHKDKTKLMRVEEFENNPTSSEPGSSRVPQDAYPDPARGHYLRVQKLIREMAILTENEVRYYRFGG